MSTTRVLEDVSSISDPGAEAFCDKLYDIVEDDYWNCQCVQ